MKTKLIFTLATLITTTVYANSQQHTNTGGGFVGPGITQVKTIQEVLNSGFASDDMVVQLTGYIKSALGDEKYIFTDKVSEIVVEIDHRIWQGREVLPTTQIQIVGEIDKELTSTTVDVKSITILGTK